MELANYFEPINIESIGYSHKPYIQQLGDAIVPYTNLDEFPSLQDVSLAIVGIQDDRCAVKNSGCAQAPDEIRKKLYPLALPCMEAKIVDLGNIAPGDTIDDTYFAVTESFYKLLERDITIVVLGGSQDFTFAIYKAYEILGRIINICAIDSRFDIDGSPKMDSRNYLKHIIMQQPNYLFNYTNIGYQTYFVGPEYVSLMDELKFDAYRLGLIQSHMESAEPLVRNADLISVDLGAVRQSDAPANGDPSPHGFYGEQLCQIARFAGMSDKTSCMGFFELNPHFDNHSQTAHMVAHAIWYFIEGFYNRQHDFPYRDKENYRRYMVQLPKEGLEINFYKSKKSNRWWCEVPCQDPERSERYERHLLVPCNYSDYEQAMNNEVPTIWWTFYQRMNDF